MAVIRLIRMVLESILYASDRQLPLCLQSIYKPGQGKSASPEDGCELLFTPLEVLEYPGDLVVSPLLGLDGLA